MLMSDLHYIVVPQHLQIFNQRPKIILDVIPSLLWPDIKPDNKIYFHLLHNQGGIFKIIIIIDHVLCAIVYEWIYPICAHCNPNIPQIKGKFKISWINVSPLCDISRMSYHSDILLMLLFMPSQQFWLIFVCKSALQMRNDRKVSKHLFRLDFSLAESTNRASLNVFILSPTI
jgi:hypothetical protein